MESNGHTGHLTYQASREGRKSPGRLAEDGGQEQQRARTRKERTGTLKRGSHSPKLSHPPDLGSSLPLGLIWPDLTLNFPFPLLATARSHLPTYVRSSIETSNQPRIPACLIIDTAASLPVFLSPSCRFANRSLLAPFSTIPSGPLCDVRDPRLHCCPVRVASGFSPFCASVGINGQIESLSLVVPRDTMMPLDLDTRCSIACAPPLSGSIFSIAQSLTALTSLDHQLDFDYSFLIVDPFFSFSQWVSTSVQPNRTAQYAMEGKRIWHRSLARPMDHRPRPWFEPSQKAAPWLAILDPLLSPTSSAIQSLVSPRHCVHSHLPFLGCCFLVLYW